MPFYMLFYSSFITHDNIPRCMVSAIHSFPKMDILPCMIQTLLHKQYDSWVMLPVYFLIVFLRIVAGAANAMNCSVQWHNEAPPTGKSFQSSVSRRVPTTPALGHAPGILRPYWFFFQSVSFFVHPPPYHQR